MESLLTLLGRKSKLRKITGIDFTSMDLTKYEITDYTFRKCRFSTLPSKITACSFKECCFNEVTSITNISYSVFSACRFVNSHIKANFFGTFLYDCVIEKFVGVSICSDVFEKPE